MQRQGLVSRCIYMNILSYLFAMASALHSNVQAMDHWAARAALAATPTRPQHPSCQMASSRAGSRSGRHGKRLPQAQRAASPPDPETQLQLSAEQQDQAESWGKGGADVWEDTAVLTYVHLQQLSYGADPNRGPDAGQGSSPGCARSGVMAHFVKCHLLQIGWVWCASTRNSWGT
jgi:hypothetical protein